MKRWIHASKDYNRLKVVIDDATRIDDAKDAIQSICSQLSGSSWVFDDQESGFVISVKDADSAVDFRDKLDAALAHKMLKHSWV